ncbi:hypothetical protein [Pedobacter punctiformis]|uniref:Uncharacterized protein n=1 Tax=Pedobacter punctiformis TaxID=3004097 RepID=A0ABT4LC98_9SPHI|nr:hypothetical protein [Pedobacter sp. HCMS5-2]MCZ4245540.1 hypothetical protein [Pedobacter sp. HCMS5-2]
MKSFFITILLVIAIAIHIKAQSIAQLDSLNNLISKHYIKLDSIFKDCQLHYTLMKMEVDDHNKIIEINSLNSIPEAFLKFFKPLQEMHFSKETNAKKTILFLYVVYPRRKCSISNGESYAKSDLKAFLPEITFLLAKQIKENPKTIYDDGSVIYSYPEYLETRQRVKTKN